MLVFSIIILTLLCSLLIPSPVTGAPRTSEWRQPTLHYAIRSVITSLTCTSFKSGKELPSRWTGASRTTSTTGP